MAQMPVEVVTIGDIQTEVFDGVVSLANSVQTELRFIRLKDDEDKAFKVLAYKRATVKDVMDKMEAVRAEIGGYHPYIIALVDTELDGERFSNIFGSHRAEKGVAVFTTSKVDDVIIPKEKIAAYMLYYLARFSLSFMVPHHKNHNETKDCVFDRKIYKPDVVKSMKARAICDECRNQLLSGELKLSPTQLSAVDLLIELSGKLLKGTVEITTGAISTNRLDALRELSEIKSRLDANAHEFAKRGLWLYFLALIVVWLALGFFTYRLGWSVMEPWTYFIGGFLTAGSYLYFAFTQRELSPKTIYDQIIESKKRKNYKEFGLDLEKYNALLGAKTHENSKP